MRRQQRLQFCSMELAYLCVRVDSCLCRHRLFHLQILQCWCDFHTSFKKQVAFYQASSWHMQPDIYTLHSPFATFPPVYPSKLIPLSSWFMERRSCLAARDRIHDESIGCRRCEMIWWNLNSRGISLCLYRRDGTLLRLLPGYDDKETIEKSSGAANLFGRCSRYNIEVEVPTRFFDCFRGDGKFSRG